MIALTYRIGQVRVHLISDGVFLTDGGATFGVVPKTLWDKVIQHFSSSMTWPSRLAGCVAMVMTGASNRFRPWNIQR
jgi:hypothetical protein